MAVTKRLMRRADDTEAKKAEIRQLMLNCSDEKLKTAYDEWQASRDTPYINARGTIVFGDEVKDLVATTKSQVSDFADYYFKLMNDATAQNPITYVLSFSSVLDQVDHVGEDDRYILQTFQGIDDVLNEINDDYLERVKKYEAKAYDELLKVAESGDVVKFVNAANALFSSMAYSGNEVLICKGCEALESTLRLIQEEVDYYTSVENPKYAICDDFGAGMEYNFDFDSREDLVDYLMGPVNGTNDVDKLDAVIELFK